MDWSWNSRATGELQSICLPFAVTGCTLSFAMTLAMNCRFILFVTTMKPNVPSPNPRFHSWRLVRRPVILLSLKLLFVGAATTFAFGLNPAVYALEPGRAWVTSWACSPQGPYPAGRGGGPEAYKSPRSALARGLFCGSVSLERWDRAGQTAACAGQYQLGDDHRRQQFRHP